jgi:hypothetical protein
MDTDRKKENMDYRTSKPTTTNCNDEASIGQRGQGQTRPTNLFIIRRVFKGTLSSTI